jgi:hypothetical protein
MIYLKEIKIGGETRPIKMGYNTVARFGDMTKRTLDQIDRLGVETMTVTDMLVLCYCALKEGARYNKQEFTATVDDVGDWIDDDENALVEIMLEYGRSRGGFEPATAKQPGEKKSAKKTTVKPSH